VLLKIESKKIMPNGILTEINGYKLHLYSEGESNNKPILVFMSGSGTPAPVYDFKQLYSLFSDEYCIVVVEKIGYGYADIVNTDRDMDVILEETRTVLRSNGYNGPYILFPHSFSGLEALYWLSKYPEEIAAIIGLDMAFPECYNHLKIPSKLQFFYAALISKLGLQRLPFMFQYKLTDMKGLTTEEFKQAKYLSYRNALNVSVRNESKKIIDNTNKVNNTNYSDKTGNVLLFSSNGKQIGDYWLSVQKDFAEKIGAELIILDCGHYIHHYESQKIAEKSKMFINELLKLKITCLINQ
jgi:predicted alpha/beta hydrolase family esterase